MCIRDRAKVLQVFLRGVLRLKKILLAIVPSCVARGGVAPLARRRAWPCNGEQNNVLEAQVSSKARGVYAPHLRRPSILSCPMF
eukprot:10219105-Lingulodinium_polyedra.AAC.1